MYINVSKQDRLRLYFTFKRFLYLSALFANFAFAVQQTDSPMSTAWNIGVKQICICRFTMYNAKCKSYHIGLHICMWCLVGATLLSYVVLQYWICIGQDNKTLVEL